jgi:hypothetical protein
MTAFAYLADGAIDEHQKRGAAAWVRENERELGVLIG